MRHLLVPTDFSDTAQNALEFAVELAKDLGGRITLLHVADTPRISEVLIGLDAVTYLSAAMDTPGAASGYAPSSQISADLKQSALKKMEVCIEKARLDPVPIEMAYEEGRPSNTIVKFANEHKLDMIVMGTRGHGSVARFFLGSVAENVVRSAECPVTTVRGA